MKRKTIKNIFLFFIIYLPLQYGLVGVVGSYHSEPWPSFVFPGFKNVYVFDSGFEIRQTEFELIDSETNQRAQLTPNQLFSEIPVSKISGFIRARFSDKEMVQSYDKITDDWLMQKASEKAGFEGDKLNVHHFTTYFSRGQSSLEADSMVTINYFLIAEKRNNEQ